MNVLKPHLQTTIWTLLKAGNSQREIERRTGISRHTIRVWAKRFEAQCGPPQPPVDSNCPGVATDLAEGAPTDPGEQTAPPRPPASTKADSSLCEPHRAFIEAQLKLGRNAMAIYQEMVDSHGFAGRYNSVKRFVARRVRSIAPAEAGMFMAHQEAGGRRWERNK